ncbi:MAG: polyprenyl synthetase family protein [Aliidongia sp.]
MISALWSDPTSLSAALADSVRAVDAVTDRLLARPDGPEARVYDAMRYAALAPGKRLRPFLVLASSHLFGVSRTSALQAAVAIELLHTYSLVHDDLPAMDDSDLRRGRPTCHKAFDDATAILAGDGLLTLAFDVLADPDTHGDPAVRVELVSCLAKAAGCAGMVGGQMIDLLAEHDHTLDIGAITRLQRLKTGALIAFSCEAGAILGKASAEHRRALIGYAHDLGLAFQIADDLLDAEGTAAETGKSVGRDAEAGKATFVSILGLDGARKQATALVAQAIGQLDCFGAPADLLRQVAHFVVARKS